MNKKSVPHGTKEIVIPALEEEMRTYVPKYRPWTKDEIAILTKYYGRVSPDSLAKQFGRTKASIMDKAQNLGLMNVRGNG